MTLPERDMYGHKIWPLGETGWGVSVSFYSKPHSESPTKLHPDFTLFHHSDPNPQQSLFSVSRAGGERFQVHNVFDDRITEVEKAIQK